MAHGRRTYLHNAHGPFAEIPAATFAPLEETDPIRRQ